MKKIIITIILTLLIITAFALYFNKPAEKITLSEEEYIELKKGIVVEKKELFNEIKSDNNDSNENLIEEKETPILDKYLDIIHANFIGGGPPKDGIPALTNPEYVSAEEADKFLNPDEIIFGMDYKGEVKAFPKSIMYWHEVVNEEIKGEKVSVTYCPLTGTTIGYKGKDLGVSGSLYNSNLVMYDRATESQIPQILGVAVNGSIKGEALESFHITQTTWQKWKTAHPNTKVLSEKTGWEREYGRNPYPGYEDALRVWFPLAAQSDKFHSKAWVVGVELSEGSIVVPKEAVEKLGTYKYTNENTEVVFNYNKDLDVVQVTSNQPIKYFDSYWFAWYAYHPETKVLEP